MDAAVFIHWACCSQVQAWFFCCPDLSKSACGMPFKLAPESFRHNHIRFWVLPCPLGQETLGPPCTSLSQRCNQPSGTGNTRATLYFPVPEVQSVTSQQASTFHKKWYSKIKRKVVDVIRVTGVTLLSDPFRRQSWETHVKNHKVILIFPAQV